MDLPLVCPLDGAPLRPDGSYALVSATGRRWPVLDGIAFLRAGREALADAALARLDDGDRGGALALLLADQDDWWRGPAARPEDLRRLVRELDRLTLRGAMALLGWGPVADYFAHRWSDPTFLAGLALVEAHWNRPATAFELACGIGHHLRELARRGVDVAGGDVVFAKLFLARHFVAPEARLVCFDAARPWPLAPFRADLVACHDAFYFLDDKPGIAARLRAMAGPDGLVAIGHVHNRERPNHSAGAGVSPAELDELFPDAVVYDDAALTRALATASSPTPCPAGARAAVDAFSLAFPAGVAGAPRALDRGLVLPPAGAWLRRNPLYGADGGLVFPSVRYAEEYGALATYPARATGPLAAVHAPDAADPAVRSRELVDLPARW